MIDCDRAEILVQSLARFFSDLGTCWVVVPDREAAAIKSRIRDKHYRVVPESSIVPELENHPRIAGWFVQQLIKLAIAQHIKSDFYLTLDADVICTRRVRSTDLIKGGRALATRYVGSTHSNWYGWASRVLNVPAPRWRYGVTPMLIHTQAMLALQGYLAYREPSRPTPRDELFSCSSKSTKGNWRQYLLRNVPWTEYALYFTFLETMGMYDEFYCHGPTCGNCVWKENDFIAWQAAKSFTGSSPYFFTVVQSNLGLPVADVWKRVRGYIEQDEVAHKDADSRGTEMYDLAKC